VIVGVVARVVIGPALQVKTVVETRNRLHALEMMYALGQKYTHFTILGMNEDEELDEGFFTDTARSKRHSSLRNEPGMPGEIVANYSCENSLHFPAPSPLML
jgi:hypothetical protein